MEFIDNILNYTSGIVIATLFGLMLVFLFALVAIVLDIIWRLIKGMIIYKFQKGWVQKSFDKYYG